MDRQEILYIATPNVSRQRSEIATQHYAYALMALGRKYPDLKIMTGTSETNFLHRGYNILYQQAKKVKADWFLTLESDMVLEEHTIWKLLEIAKHNDYDFLAAMYFENSIAEPKTLLNIEIDKTSEGMPKWMASFPGPLYRPVYDYPENTIVEVDATGLGCTLIRMDALRKVENESTEYEEDIFLTHFTRTGLTQYSEDIAICYLLKRQGYRILVHTGIQLGHVSRESRIIDQNHYLDRIEKAKTDPDWSSDFDRTVQANMLADEGGRIPADKLPQSFFDNLREKKIPVTQWAQGKPMKEVCKR